MDAPDVHQPLVSVIIPVRDGIPFLRAAIESVLAQTYPRVECIVIDDGSRDETPAVIAGFGSRIRSYSQLNQGVANARNRGAQLARGELLVFLDADDCVKPVSIERQVRRLLEHPEASVVYTALELIDEDDCHIGFVPVPPPSCAFANTLLSRPPALGLVQAALIRREVFVGVGGFDEQLSTSADCDLACRLTRSYPFEAIDEPLCAYRQHANQMHRDLAALERDMGIIYRKMVRADEQNRVLVRHARANLHLILANAYWREEERRGVAMWHLGQAALDRPMHVSRLAARRLARFAQGYWRIVQSVACRFVHGLRVTA